MGNSHPSPTLKTLSDYMAYVRHLHGALNITTDNLAKAGLYYMIKDEKSCEEYLKGNAITPTGPRCNFTFDTIMCWPSTPVNETVSLPCPPLVGLDPTKSGHRKCGPDGKWEGQFHGDTRYPNGWTNYTACYTPESLELYNKIFGSSSVETIKEIAQGTRVMELVGLSLSFLCLAMSLFIFMYFRTLRCHRTRIHRNLFFAIMVHVAMRLLMHADQAIARRMGGIEIGGSTFKNFGTISNTHIICELQHCIVEYTKSSMFMWMFIEGTYLHSMIVVTVMSTKPNYLYYYLLAWGLPLANIVAWATTNVYQNSQKCWFGYVFEPVYWLIEGPRIAVICVNLIFLLNIIRVLVTKLRESHSTEAQQVRKAVKAAMVLLPLLGLNNILEMIPGPTEEVAFGVWSYGSHFLSAFQGFFISLLYCFLNSEVQCALRTHWERFQLGRAHPGNRRLSRNASIFTSVTEINAHQVNPGKKFLWFPLRRWKALPTR